MVSVSIEIFTNIVMKENLKIACIVVKEKKPGLTVQLLRGFIKMGGETEKE